MNTGALTAASATTYYPISSKGAETYNVSANDQTIAAGNYLTGAQTIRGVAISGIAAENIKSGVVAKIGDADNDSRIISVTGTYVGEPLTGDALASQVASGKSFYSDSYTKQTGTAAIATTSYDATNTKLTITGGLVVLS